MTKTAFMEDLVQIARAKRAGILMPVRAHRAAARAGLPFHVACAYLVQETSGGQNIFGHDPTIFAGAGEVTRDRYLRYLKARGPRGEGGMQGVGPMQLTYWSIQDLADSEGGCWKPSVNMYVGFSLVAEYFRTLGSWLDAAERYNGSESYAREVFERQHEWRRIINGDES